MASKLPGTAAKRDSQITDLRKKIVLQPVSHRSDHRKTDVNIHRETHKKTHRAIRRRPRTTSDHGQIRH